MPLVSSFPLSAYTRRPTLWGPPTKTFQGAFWLWKYGDKKIHLSAKMKIRTCQITEIGFATFTVLLIFKTKQSYKTLYECNSLTPPDAHKDMCVPSRIRIDNADKFPFRAMLWHSIALKRRIFTVNSYSKSQPYSFYTNTVHNVNFQQNHSIKLVTATGIREEHDIQ